MHVCRRSASALHALASAMCGHRAAAWLPHAGGSWGGMSAAPQPQGSGRHGAAALCCRQGPASSDGVGESENPANVARFQLGSGKATAQPNCEHNTDALPHVAVADMDLSQPVVGSHRPTFMYMQGELPAFGLRACGTRSVLVLPAALPAALQLSAADLSSCCHSIWLRCMHPDPVGIPCRRLPSTAPASYTRHTPAGRACGPTGPGCARCACE